MLSERIRSRLLNGKFEQAYKYASDAGLTEDEIDLIAALAVTFGNAGGMSGHMGTIVSAAVHALLTGYAPEDPNVFNVIASLREMLDVATSCMDDSNRKLFDKKITTVLNQANAILNKKG